MAQQIQPQHQPRQEYQSVHQPVRSQPQQGQPQPQVGVQPSSAVQPVVGGQFETELSPTLQTALDNFTTVKNKAKWAADKTVAQGPQPQVTSVVQAYHDVRDAAAMAENAIARNSTATSSFAQAFITIASQSLQTLQTQAYNQQPHVSETVDAIQQTLTTAQQVVTELSQQSAGMASIHQPVGQQMPQQQPVGQQHQQQPVRQVQQGVGVQPQSRQQHLPGQQSQQPR